MDKRIKFLNNLVRFILENTNDISELAYILDQLEDTENEWVEFLLDMEKNKFSSN